MVSFFKCHNAFNVEYGLMLLVLLKIHFDILDTFFADTVILKCDDVEFPSTDIAILRQFLMFFLVAFFDLIGFHALSPYALMENSYNS